jgi:hypothetical protein
MVPDPDLDPYSGSRSEFSNSNKHGSFPDPYPPSGIGSDPERLAWQDLDLGTDPYPQHTKCP